MSERGIERPRTRGDCYRVPRPCPFVSCRHHLYLDVQRRRLRLVFPDQEPHQLAHSCSLDLADRGGMTLQEVSEAFGVTRERIRQLVAKAAPKLAEGVVDE